MIIKLKIAVDPDHNNGKKIATVKAWKSRRGVSLAIHKSFGASGGYNITQTQVGLYIPPTSISLVRCLEKYRLMEAEDWQIRKPVFGKVPAGKKYKHLLNICKQLYD